MNIYGIIFSSYEYHRCTIQNEIWMCVSVLCQRYTRYTGEITWKTTSKTTESTSQNNRLFLKTNPLLLLQKQKQKQKQKLLQKQQQKLSRKKIFFLVRRTSRPERSFLFLDRMILVKRRMAVQEAFALPWGTPPQLRIRSAAPPEVEPRALRAGLHHSSNHTVDVQTPPASLHSATSPSRGGKGASRRACTLIWVLAEIRGYGRMLSVPWFKWGSWFHSTRMSPDYSIDFVTNHNRLNCTGSYCFVRVLPF